VAHHGGKQYLHDRRHQRVRFGVPRPLQSSPLSSTLDRRTLEAGRRGAYLRECARAKIALLTAHRVHCQPKQAPWQATAKARGRASSAADLRSALNIFHFHSPIKAQLCGFSTRRSARQLNEQPRKTLTFETPAERFNVVLHRSVEPTAV